jgi:phage gp36-like protein
VSEHITATDLANAAGQKAVDRMFDDDGDGLADTAIVAGSIGQACATADSLLLQGFPDAQQRATLIDADELCKMHIAWLAMHYRGRARNEFRDDQGRAIYWQEYADALKYLTALAKAQQRSAGEATAGANVNVGGNLNRDRQPPAPPFIFAGSPDKPAGSGGF